VLEPGHGRSPLAGGWCPPCTWAHLAVLFWDPGASPRPAVPLQWLLTIGVDVLVFACCSISSKAASTTPRCCPAGAAGIHPRPLTLAWPRRPASRCYLLGEAWLSAPLLSEVSTARLLQSGLTGTGFFLVALLANQLAQRLAREEAVAKAARPPPAPRPRSTNCHREPERGACWWSTGTAWCATPTRRRRPCSWAKRTPSRPSCCCRHARAGRDLARLVRRPLPSARALESEVTGRARRVHHPPPVRAHQADPCPVGGRPDRAVRAVPGRPARGRSARAHRKTGLHGPHVGGRGARNPQPAVGHHPGQCPAGRRGDRSRPEAPDAHDRPERAAPGAHRGRHPQRGPRSPAESTGNSVPRCRWTRRCGRSRTNGTRQNRRPGVLGVHLPPAGRHVAFDPEHLRRLLVNLLDNALRHASGRLVDPRDHAAQRPGAGAHLGLERRRPAGSQCAQAPVRTLLFVREPLQRPGPLHLPRAVRALWRADRLPAQPARPAGRQRVLRPGPDAAGPRQTARDRCSRA
jgi:two-component system, NtrC family, sensor histidine kinase PilS